MLGHCKTYRQVLFVIHLKPTLEAVMHDTFKIANGVKRHAVNMRLFRELCQDDVHAMHVHCCARPAFDWS